MRFVKLELTWYGSPWLRVLSDGSRLAWVMLLCYAKASGMAGRVKRMDPDFASRQWLLGEEDVRRMEEAAIRDGALAVDGTDWVVANWAKYQSDETAAERQKRFREAKGMAESNGSNALRSLRNGEEKRREEKRINPPVSPLKGGTRPSEREFFDFGNEINLPNMQIEMAWDHFTANGWKVGRNPLKDWKAALRNWKRRWETGR